MGSTLDAFVAFSLAALLIVGGYQIYFLPQKYPLRRPLSLLISIDERIPFRPRWVWVYSFLYYPFIVSTILTIQDFRQFAYTCANFMILLVTQVAIAFIFPVKTPSRWRDYNPHNSVSERFLGIVHSFDKGGNCFPSMHIAVAMLSALHTANNLLDRFGAMAYCVFVLPVLIAISTVFTKQHYLLDIPAGAALAIAIFSLHRLVYP
jgi:membrane-associated phospholipid phosphatase